MGYYRTTLYSMRREGYKSAKSCKDVKWMEEIGDRKLTFQWVTVDRVQ